MKMKKSHLFIKIISLLMVVVMCLTGISVEAFAATKKKLHIATISGISYVSESNRGGYNEAFLLDAASKGYQYEQLDGILASAFESFKAKVKK